LPVINIQSIELTQDMREKIAKKFAKIFAEETIVEEEDIYIFFDSYPPKEVARGKVLFSKKYPNFYDNHPDYQESETGD